MRTNRNLVTAALVPTLALGGIGLGTAATTVLATAGVAAAAPTAEVAAASSWSTPTPMPGLPDGMHIKDLVTMWDGRSVAVWYYQAPNRTDAALMTSIRPANSTVWGKPIQLDLVRASLDSVKLVADPDGSTSLAWISGLSESAAEIKTARLPEGLSQWTDHSSLPFKAGTTVKDFSYAYDPDSGRRMAVWRATGSDDKLYASQSSPSQGWSTPVSLASTTVAPRVAVGRDGTFTVAAQNGSGVFTLTKAAGSTRWSGPVVVSGARKVSTPPLLSVGRDGTTAVSWSYATGQNEETGDEGNNYVLTSVRKAGSSTWGAPEELMGWGSSAVLQASLIGPKGEITLLWTNHSSEGSWLRTATRAPSGSWSAIKELDLDVSHTQVDASIGEDGTVVVGWPSESRKVTHFVTSVRRDGVWATTRTRLSTVPTEVKGAVAVNGAAGEATAVWPQGNQLWASGTGISAVAPKFRDHAGWSGAPDLFAQNAKGDLWVYHGANQTLSDRTYGGSWPTTSFVVPFGDLNRDGCNDTLVRTAAGELIRYTPACGTAVTPQSPATKIGSGGWGQFDELTYSGDFNRDGLPDLVARQASTGDLYLYKGTAAGTLANAGKIATGRKSMLIVGAGDLNGDGNADLLTRTSTGSLYRYDGTGKGTLGSPVKIASGWGGMVNVVGIGDLTGDGKNDLVARNAAGELFRYAGTGQGTFGAAAITDENWKAFANIR
ncbi:FG-GAP repeat domain-containing protein [Streptomyces sp. NPDC056883]|uniref:FG-GAP repeat domain-containing protein n=1 Tax=Streptomyces sp. NPDC056883 TaxID=3345959 RepID=UPI00368917DE